MKQSIGLAKEEAAALLANAKAQAAKALPHLPAAYFAVELLEKVLMGRAVEVVGDGGVVDRL